ncbi:hypothetical protein DXG01_008516 [Tephrocybe rancida]|nr:hypothetical protein DXG01_008516 [Tephrocybe rancida]
MTNKKGKRWEEEITANDVFINDDKPGDLIIPIMGPTGCGKSTFINTFLGGIYAQVGHDPESATQQIQYYRLPSPLHHIVVVDTPGFDDTYRSDREILRRIAVWMAKSYSTGMKVAGIIYLHDITANRLTGTMGKNFDMFEKLCGPNAASNVVIVTTKWSDDPQKEVVREAEFRDFLFKDMLHLGSKMHRFDNTQSSARAIINEILALKVLDAIRIQSELVDIDRMLAETDAGRALRRTLEKLLQRQKEAAKNFERDGGDGARDAVIDNDFKIRSYLSQIKDLSIPLKRRVLHLFGLLDS